MSDESDTPRTAWTSERPTDPGYYWARGDLGGTVEEDDLHMYYLDPKGEWWCMGWECAISLDGLEWQRAEPRP